jgi:Domain of Unknown Function with PDB structure (DUF3857)/Transglutaminase-like superfamily
LSRAAVIKFVALVYLIGATLLSASMQASFMSNHRFLQVAGLAILVISSVASRAQFRAPSEEELRMTADPRAPGADAVYLDYEENDDDKGHFQDYYARVKVLTEKGKEAANVEISYPGGPFSIGSISGRTIHADGTIVPLTVKPEDLLVAKSGAARTEKTVFEMPSVEVGSVLEYSYQVRYNMQFYWHHSPYWQVQQRYFVHRAHYQFVPFDALNLIDWPHLPTGVNVKIDAAGRYILEISDVPPIPDEEWMPPIESILYKVRFYYRSRYQAMDEVEFWKNEMADWSKDVDRFAEPGKAIHDAVSGLIAPSDSDQDKAKKLYAAVQALENTDYSRAKSETERKELKLKDVKRAEDIWTQKSGTSNEIALLYMAMLRAAGLTAYGVTIVDREKAVFDPSYMNFDQFSVELVIVSAGGKEVMLDPGEKMCPFGMLGWSHASAQGVRQNAGGPEMVTTPEQAYSSNVLRRTGDIAVDPQGAITGDIQVVMAGQEALQWRQIALEVDETELKKQFNENLEQTVPASIEAHVDHFLGLDEPDRNLMAIVKVRGQLGTATAKRLILPGFFFETRANEPFTSQAERLEPVDMHYGEQLTDQLTYDLPTGFSIEGAPQDAKLSWEGHALYVVKTKTDPGQIIVARVLARAMTFAKPDEYQDLRGFYQKVAAADQEQIVLSSAPGAKGK